MKSNLRNPSYLLSSTCTWECEDYLSDLNRYSYASHGHGCDFCLGLKKSYTSPSFGEIDCRNKHQFIERMDDLKKETYRPSEEAKNRSRSYESYAIDVIEDKERTDPNLDYIRSSNANKVMRRIPSDKPKELNASNYATCCSSESVSTAQSYHCFFCSDALSSQSSFSQHMLACLQNKALQSQNMRQQADKRDTVWDTNKISRFKSPKETSPQVVAKKKFKHRRTFPYERNITSSDVLLRSTPEHSDSSNSKVKGLDFSCTKNTQFNHNNETVHTTRNQGYPSHSWSKLERDTYDDGNTKEKACKYNGEKWSTDRNIFSCMLCHERFFTEVALHQHLRTHSGKKTFQCRFCQKAFAHQTSLIGHEAQHWQQQLHYSLDQET